MSPRLVGRSPRRVMHKPPCIAHLPGAQTDPPPHWVILWYRNAIGYQAFLQAPSAPFLLEEYVSLIMPRNPVAYYLWPKTPLPWTAHISSECHSLLDCVTCHFLTTTSQGFPLVRIRIFLNFSEYFQTRRRADNSEYSRPFRNISKYQKSGVLGFGLVYPLPFALLSFECLDFVAPLHSSVSASDELPSEQAQQATQSAKQPRKRGTKMTEAKRAAQFSDDMEVRNNGAQMWCKHCGLLVQQASRRHQELLASIQKEPAMN